jgi:WD40 repeat protein
MSKSRRAPGLLACLAVTVAAALAVPAAGGEERPARVDLHGDPLPPGVLARLGTTRLYLPGADCLAFSPDGKYLAATSRPGVAGRLFLVEVSTAREVWGDSLPKSYGWSAGWRPLAFSPDGKTLALGCADQSVRLWDVGTGKQLRRLWVVGHPTHVAFDPAGQCLAVGVGDDQIQIWDPARGERIKWLKRLGACAGLAFSPDGKTLIALVTAAKPGSVALARFDVVSGEERLRRELPKDTTYFLSPAGRHLAALPSAGDGFSLLDPATGERVRRAEGDEVRVFPADFSSDGRTLAAVGRDGAARVWDADTGKMLHRLPPMPGRSRCIAVSPGSKVLAQTGWHDHAVRLWDVPRGKELHAFPGHRAGPLAVAFAPDGKTVATASRFSMSPTLGGAVEWSLRLWDAASGKELRVTRRLEEGDVRMAHFAPAGDLLVDVSADGTLRLWDVPAGKELRRWGVPIAYTQHFAGGKLIAKNPRPAVSPPTFFPDAKTLIASGEEAVHRWEVGTGKELPPLKLPEKSPWPYCLASPDGRTLLVKFWDGREHRGSLLDARSGRVLRDMPRKGSLYPSCAFSPDGRTLAVPDGSGVALWEVASGLARGRLHKGQANITLALAFSPDGRLLAAGGDESEPLRLWRLTSEDIAGRLRGHSTRIDSLSFSPEGARLAVAGEANTALVCDVAALLGGGAAERLTAERLEALWDELAGADGARAYQAVQRLAASPDQAVPFLRSRLKGRPPPDERRLARLITELGDDRFGVREQAARELEALGVRAEPALRRALEGKLSAEARRRAERLLEKLRPGGAPLPTPELVALRVLEALELGATPAARQVISEIARAQHDARLTDEARAALGRLAARTPAAP